MEKVKTHFDELVANYKSKKIEYWATFDPADGAVKGIYPNHSIPNTKNKLKIDQDFAEQIISGSIQLSKCRIDTRKKTFRIIETKHLQSLDDILHRIIDVKYFDNEDIDVKLMYNKVSRSLTVKMAYYLGGTHKTSRRRQKKKMSWSGSTILPFSITEYNDPNIIMYSFECSINDLMGKDFVVDNLDLDTKNFSVYTKRVFDNYVIEIL
jgi:hypothetical protein